MCKWQQEPQDHSAKDRRHDEDAIVAVKRRSDSFCAKQYSGDVVIPAFREIEKQFEAEGTRVWIHVEANRTWLAIGCRAAFGDKEECTKRLKYQVEVSGQTMKSRLYQIMSVGLQKECPIGDAHEIAGNASGKNIADITSKDIIGDFTAAFEGYADKKMKS